MYNDHYIVITSEDSKDVYPENTVSNFKVRLAKRLALDEHYEVACVRFSFTDTLSAFNVPQKVRIMADSKPVVSLSIKPQHFNDVYQLCDVINERIKTKVNIGDADTHPLLAIDKHDRVFTAGGTIQGKVHTLEFSPVLETILGLRSEGLAQLTAFKTDLYVYSDICTPSIVGDASVPLLTSINLGSTVSYGEQDIRKIRNPTYVKLATRDILDIEIQLLDDTGRPPYFAYGSVTLTLHFRRRK